MREYRSHWKDKRMATGNYGSRGRQIWDVSTRIRCAGMEKTLCSYRTALRAIGLILHPRDTSQTRNRVLRIQVTLRDNI